MTISLTKIFVTAKVQNFFKSCLSLGIIFFMYHITKSNVPDYIGKKFLFNKKNGENIEIGTGLINFKPVYKIPFTEVTNFKEISEETQDNSSGKDIGKTVGRIAGIPFGVAGVLAGGALGSSKKKNTNRGNYAIEFNKEDWLVFEIEDLDAFGGVGGRSVIEAMFKEFADIQDNPFD